MSAAMSAWRSHADGPAVWTEGLMRRFGDNVAVDDVDLEVARVGRQAGVSFHRERLVGVEYEWDTQAQEVAGLLVHRLGL